jgi:hypothetical protein
MKRTPLTAMLTILAIVAGTMAIAGCGGKSSGSGSEPAQTTTTSHKHKSKPAY